MNNWINTALTLLAVLLLVCFSLLTTSPTFTPEAVTTTNAPVKDVSPAEEEDPYAFLYGGDGEEEEDPYAFLFEMDSEDESDTTGEEDPYAFLYELDSEDESDTTGEEDPYAFLNDF